MKKIFKSPHSIIRRVLSQTSNLSSPSHDQKSLSQSDQFLMSGEQQMQLEIQSLKAQIGNLKAAVNTLHEDTEKREIAVAEIAREKEKITMELLKQKRSYRSLLLQLEEERKFYYKEKEAYCKEMTQYKKLRQALSSTTTATSSTSNSKENEQSKKEIAKIKLMLNQTLEANYNLSIKFLRMKNTKTCLKSEYKTLQLEYEKLVNDYKAKIHDLSQELNNLILKRLNSPISGSSKKYLNLVKQNSCLVYENLCLQLEVDNLRLKYQKLKLSNLKNETNSKLKYIKHNEETKKTYAKKQKKIRIKEERPVKDVQPIPSTSTDQCSNEIQKIFERYQLPDIPNIQMFSNEMHNQNLVQASEENTNVNKNIKISQKSSSKLDLFQISNTTSKSSIQGSLVRVRSLPEIIQRD
ncbi:hypothetical protein ABEB36_010406 [Hypothenemus hampei]|uniref:Uncharacterized protein n=1 Tax=Hypothenemus hampei TaxID=57062 RepID=A0ABD1EJT4_HYPHA